MTKYLQLLHSHINQNTPVAHVKVEATLLAHLLEDRNIPENIYKGLLKKFPNVVEQHSDKIVVVGQAEKHDDSNLPIDVIIANKYRKKARNAQERNIQFSLTFSQFKKLLQRKTCGYTGLPLCLTEKDSDMSPTIERIDGNKGYVQGNVLVVASKYNQLKNELFENSVSKIHCDMQGVYKMMLKLKELGQIK